MGGRLIGWGDRNKPKAPQPEKVEPAAPELDLDGLEVTPQPELAATMELLQGQIAALRGAEDRHGELDAVVTMDDRRREWIARNPLAQQHAAELNDLHRDALGAGLVDTSPSYFEFMDSRLAARAEKTPAAAASHLVADMERSAQHAAPAQRQQEAASDISPRYVSAPVSRSASLSGPRRGSINLSAEQREAAKVAGISEAKYARQLVRFEEMRDSGMIQRWS